MLARVAAHHHAIVPIDFEHLCGDARRARVRERAQVAHAGVDVQLAVGADAHQSIKAISTRRVIGLTHTDADDLGALALPAELLLRRPVKTLGTLRQRIFQIAAGGRRALGAAQRAGLRRVEQADGEAIDTQFARGLVEQGLDDMHQLVVAGAALRTAHR